MECEDTFASFIVVVGKDGETTVDQRRMLVMETLAESEKVTTSGRAVSVATSEREKGFIVEEQIK